MASDDYIKAVKTIAKERDISEKELNSLIEDSLAKAYKKNLLEDDARNAEIRAVVDESGYKVYCKKEISVNVSNPLLEISIDDAEAVDPNATIGEKIEVEVTPANFGRIAAHAFRQAINQKINETEKNRILDQYEHQKGLLVTGKITRKDILPDGSVRYIADLGKIEATLPAKEQIPGENLSLGELVKFYLWNIRTDENRNTRVIELSRSHPGLIQRLFELEVPEMESGYIEIISIVREAGSRTKISVKSNSENIEPLGACIGINGSRIQAVVNQINGEKIDIVEYSDDPAVYIANALSPAVPVSVETDEENHHATVTVPKKQLSLAIGKNGQNVRLAAKLTTWKMDIVSQES